MPNFRQVHEEEQNDEILKKRAGDPQLATATKAIAKPETLVPSPAAIGELPLVGLALSGGGIRSATFNLGVLQGLAKFKLLHRIDYLSTVSGGGYIGSWLITWIKRTSTRHVEQKLGDYEVNPDTGIGGPEPEPQEINFLRDYSNYLTPRKGIFGADTWAGIATYLRNVLLNQFILIAFLGSILFLPWTVVQARIWIPGYLWSFHHLTVACFFFVAFTIVMASYHAALCSRTGKLSPKVAQQPMVLLSVVLPLFIGALFTLLLVWNNQKDARQFTIPYLDRRCDGVCFWVVVTAALYGGAHLLGLLPRWIVTRDLPADQKMPRWAWSGIPFFAAIAGGVGGSLVFLLTKLIAHWSSRTPSSIWYAASFGPPLIILIFLLIGVVHIGLLKLLIKNEEQEWWARLSGWLLIWSIAWAGLFSLAIFAPLGELYLAGWVKTKIALSAGWMLTTVAGLLSGRSKKTSGQSGGNPVLERLAWIAPYVFVIGLLILLSLGVHTLASHPPLIFKADSQGVEGKCSPGQSESPAKCSTPETVSITVMWETPAHATAGQPCCNSLPASGTITLEGKPVAQSKAKDERLDNYWPRVRNFPPKWLATSCAGLFAIALLLAFRVDINAFSMNLLYRNRLVRCYLGATRPEENRHPNPFTGFDPDDDQLLKNFSSQATGPGSEEKYDGPYPIFCAALNVTHGERLAWQERKAESFVFTPRYCGFDFPEMHLVPELPESFLSTYEFAYPRSGNPETQRKIGGVHIGTAMSISGAAASPNMGFHTSPPLAFLMTMFDVRLGWWLPNPRYKTEQYRFKPEGGPPISLLYLLHELFASTTDRSKYVYVSDGGHFENLAIYELVRRRCRYIIACDADADESMAFGDLGNAIRKCRSDFGVEIKIDPSPLRLTDSGFAQRHAVVGTIRYPCHPNEAPEPDGKLLYIKTTITKKLPADVLAYRIQDPAFPHKTTADQWFGESQFESYRRLGLYSVESLFPEGPARQPKGLTVEEFFTTAATPAAPIPPAPPLP